MTMPLFSLHSLETWMLGYLLNSLWQVPLIFLAAWLAARMLRPFGPRVEHRVWVGAMMIEVILPACRLDVPAAWWWLASFARAHFGGTSEHGTARVVQGAGIAAQGSALQLPGLVLACIAWAYAASLLYFAGRIAWGVWRTSRLRRAVVPAPARWARRLDLMGAKVAVSSMVSGPSTIGLRRGLLLLPPALLEAATEGDLDAALAHECAHIERGDFAKNLAYQLASLPVAYHPVLWHTRARIAETREMICDAMAAEAVRGRESYARSLLKLASIMTDLQSSSARTIHAIGMFDANNFERRIMNLVEKRIEMSLARRFLLAALCGVVAIGTCTSALALRVDVSPLATTRSGSDSSAHQPVYRVGNGVTAPSLIYSVDPEFPKTEAGMERSGFNGVCVLNIVVDDSGNVTQARIAKGLRREFDSAALAAVRQYRFKPAMRNGLPVAVSLKMEVNFRKY